MRQHEERASFSHQRLAEIQKRLTGVEALLGDRACIYTTGSYGRIEACQYSDLDVFVVIDETKDAISSLDIILAVAELIKNNREFGLPDFSNEGIYLQPQKIRDLVSNLGRPEDDAVNTFTMRLLLLLESRPLVGVPAYRRAIHEVVQSYWRDYRGREKEFIPAFLANDILRLWRTLCVNYEVDRNSTQVSGVGKNPNKVSKQKLKNYKLKHSRMMTCYSALIYLLNLYKNQKTVHPAEAENMALLTPLDRIHYVIEDERNSSRQEISSAADRIVDLYDDFLEMTNKPQHEQIEMFDDRERARKLNLDSSQLGREIVKLLTALGGDNAFLRILLV